jgi:hypothetical protein
LNLNTVGTEWANKEVVFADFRQQMLVGDFCLRLNIMEFMPKKWTIWRFPGA